MKLESLIFTAQGSKLVLRKKYTPRLFVVVIGNKHGGRSYGGFQPIAGKGLYGCFPYILQFSLPGLSYLQLLQTDGWFPDENSQEEYEFFRDLTEKYKWDVSEGIDHIAGKLSGATIVSYSRE